MTISQRRDRLRQRLRADGLDAILVTRLVNVRYLAGFTGSNAALLIHADDETPVLATDGRYRTQAGQQVPDAEIVIERACGPILAGRAAADGVGGSVSRATWSRSKGSMRSRRGHARPNLSARQAPSRHCGK